MKRIKKRPVSFDAMVRFFIRHYGIPTKRDIFKLMTRLDQLEELIETTGALERHRGIAKRKVSKGKTSVD